MSKKQMVPKVVLGASISECLWGESGWGLKVKHPEGDLAQFGQEAPPLGVGYTEGEVNS